MIKALALFSGGLDSVLAAKLILEQGIKVEALYLNSVFLSKREDADVFALRKEAASQIGINMHTVDISREHLKLVLSPRYGYGANSNPCIDCRILMLKKAKSFMKKHGFSFLISGEVLGQRPMSQRKDSFNIIDRDAGVKGILLRPLSAKLLRVTISEENGWVDRGKLESFSGRSRKPQLMLAARFGIRSYSSPSGGCLLTEPEFSRKVRDLSKQKKIGLKDVRMLKLGRHFRVDKKGPKIIIGRNEAENKKLLALSGPRDILFRARDFSGPVSVCCMDAKTRQDASDEEKKALIKTAAGFTAYYGKGAAQKTVFVEFWKGRSSKKKIVEISPALKRTIEKTRV